MRNPPTKLLIGHRAFSRGSDVSFFTARNTIILASSVSKSPGCTLGETIRKKTSENTEITRHICKIGLLRRRRRRRRKEWSIVSNIPRTIRNLHDHIDVAAKKLCTWRLYNISWTWMWKHIGYLSEVIRYTYVIRAASCEQLYIKILWLLPFAGLVSQLKIAFTIAEIIHISRIYSRFNRFITGMIILSARRILYSLSSHFRSHRSFPTGHSPISLVLAEIQKTPNRTEHPVDSTDSFQQDHQGSPSSCASSYLPLLLRHVPVYHGGHVAVHRVAWCFLVRLPMIHLAREPSRIIVVLSGYIFAAGALTLPVSCILYREHNVTPGRRILLPYRQ